ncbi:MAG: gliding motility-associated C-terminal domain-containing protein [Muribaculaceae bacterium]|nr:gliding motility-associated C-terminal domain-containing protein [Muribaculaceae bacterium]
MLNFKKNILISIFLLTAIICRAGVSFSGNSMPVFTETPIASTGLNAIYVLNSITGTSLIYTAKSANATVKWYKYGQMGGGYAEEITNITFNDNTSRLDQIIPDSGYIIEEGTDRTYFWVINYANYNLALKSITFNGETECDVMSLNVDGVGNEISYYTINGQYKTLSRNLTLSYNTLQWNAETKSYENAVIEKQLDSFKSIIATQAPLCNTIFTIQGDRFLDYWGAKNEVASDLFQTQAVQVQAIATQTNANNENTLGGSAPAVIDFSGYITDAVVFKEWQIASDSEFENIIYKFTEENITYTFNEAGTFYVRFMGANNDGVCSSYSETFEVSIGESSLECPNAFSPQSSEGINDTWKVSYKSIISFQCNIFNRWGVELYSFTDPAGSWDGKYKGKYVDSGVYFYVIQAKGADGKEYKMSGDINIIQSKK